MFGSFGGIIQGVIIGAVLAFLTALIIINIRLQAARTRVNGWVVVKEAGQPGNGILLRAACAISLPAVNVMEEAAYWTTTVDGTGQALNGRHRYLLRFPAGQLPPNNAFWSLTMNDTEGYMVKNPIQRYSINDRSGLAPNADGSIDIYIQNTAPEARESNWLPAPSGNFKLMLRAYWPGPAILSGEYRVPPVERVQ